MQDNPKNIDQLFRKHQNQFDKMPSDNAWSRLENMLDQTQSVQEEADARVQSVQKSRFKWRYAAAAILLLTFCSLGWFFMQQLNNNSFIAGKASSAEATSQKSIAKNEVKESKKNRETLPEAAKTLPNTSKKKEVSTEKTEAFKKSNNSTRGVGNVTTEKPKQKDKALVETQTANKAVEEKSSDFYSDTEDAAVGKIVEEAKTVVDEEETIAEIITEEVEEVVEFESEADEEIIEEVEEDMQPSLDETTPTTTSSSSPVFKEAEEKTKVKNQTSPKDADYDDGAIVEELERSTQRTRGQGLYNSVRTYKSPQYNWLIGEWQSEDGFEISGTRAGTFDLQLNEFSFQHGDAVLSRTFEIMESADGMQLKVIDLILDKNTDDTTIRIFKEAKSSNENELIFEYLGDGSKKQIVFKNDANNQFSIQEINGNDQKSTIFRKK